MNPFRFAILLGLGLAGHALAAAPVTIQVEEAIGRSWTEAVVWRSVEVAQPGRLPVAPLSLWRGQQVLPMQATEVERHPDGSLHRAKIWFRIGLAPNEQVTLELRAQEATPPSTGEDGQAGVGLAPPADGARILGNEHTAVRLAWGDAARPGPVLGIRLPSGKWTGRAQLVLPEGVSVTGVTTSVAEEGPLLVQTRTAYVLSNGGSYELLVALRAGEALVRLDERYRAAGALRWEFGGEAAPTHLACEVGFRGQVGHRELTYEQETALPGLIGWDVYQGDRAHALELRHATTGDLCGLVSTSADWLPTPDDQLLRLTAAPGPTLTALAPLTDGHRHWGLLAATTAMFPAPALDLLRWWNRQIVLPLDRVVNWQLTWPGMTAVEFPHTFFGRDELPGIRDLLQGTPEIARFMAELRAGKRGHPTWSSLRGESKQWPEARRQAFAAYEARYRERGGIPRDPSYVAAAYLFSGDRVYLEQLADAESYDGYGTEQYLDRIIDSFLLDVAPFADRGYTAYLHVVDHLMLRYLALEFLLGGDTLTPEHKQRLLSKLAFVVYLMHQAEWQPPIHQPDGSRPQGYPQGTANMKHDAFAGRAITACLLGNHPQLPTWLDFAVAEAKPHYPWTIHDSGALLESPYYTSRDTSRYGLFWLALRRQGVSGHEEMVAHVGRAFAYLANMLTPPEPRFGGRRVYHPLGRSSSGVVDPTFMIGAEPWATGDPAHGQLMRWAWEEQGRPDPDIAGNTGGRNVGLTMLGFAQMLKYPRPATAPLASRRFAGMGTIMRSQVASGYESNVVFRHDPFSWDLYPGNNGAVYFYGKGAPLLPRFGGYWMRDQGQCSMMSIPFGNRVLFTSGDNGCLGRTTDCALLGDQADQADGISADGHWRRQVLFAKDLEREDAVYLLVRDDVHRPGSGSVLHWWVMSKEVQPNGFDQPGVVPVKYPGHDDQWLANLGRNWAQHAAVTAEPPAAPGAPEPAPAAEPPPGPPSLVGPRLTFRGQCGVDVELFLAAPRAPRIVTDAAGVGPVLPGAVNRLYEYQQLVRVEPPPEAEAMTYLTLLVPRWPGEAAATYTALAGECGVKVVSPRETAWLFLAPTAIEFSEADLRFHARAGYCRREADRLRLLVQEGTLATAEATLSTTRHAALILSPTRAELYTDDPQAVAELAGPHRQRTVTRHLLPRATP